jgi:uncharacterized protein
VADAFPWRAEAGSLIVATRVTPRADCDAIAGWGELADGRPVLLARVRAIAEDGKANDAARRLLAKAAGVPASAVALLAGATARLKSFRIAGEPAALATALARASRADGAS